MQAERNQTRRSSWNKAENTTRDRTKCQNILSGLMHQPGPEMNKEGVYGTQPKQPYDEQ